VIFAGLSASAAEPDKFTPLIASPLTNNVRPVLGTDGKVHVVYELVLTNTSPTPATPKKTTVLEGASSKPLKTYEGKELLSHLRTMAGTPTANAAIEFNGTRLLLIDLALDPNTGMPESFSHRFDALGAPAPGGQPATPILATYTAATLPVEAKIPQIGPPVAGKGWVALNGCCEASGVHRGTGLAVNGKIYFAQRFAIDWMGLDGAGRLVHGDPSDVHNYPGYGADALAVADGTVVATLDTLEDQKPGMLPDRKTITLENVDGNHIVVDLGGGVYAFYAHLQKGSIAVQPGAHVRRGQVLGKVGNTGNTSAPHLHFHLMEGRSVLGSNGIPYTIDSFTIRGRIPAAEFAAAHGVEGDWSKGMFSTPSSRRGQFPLDLDIVDFPEQH
jgi:hypothetical protein